MQNLLWNYNPLTLAYNGIISISNYLSTDNQYSSIVKKPVKGCLDNYKLIIFDMDGVLRKGNDVIPLADITFNKIKESGLPICIITNQFRKSPKKIKKELISMGFNIDTNINLISASGLMLLEIVNIMKNNKIPQSKLCKNKSMPPIIKFGFIGENEYFNYIKGSMTNKFSNCAFYSIKNEYTPQNIDYFIIGSLNNDENINDYINKAIRWFGYNPNASILISSPDTIDVEIMENLTYYSAIPLLNKIQDEASKLNSDFKVPNNWTIVGKPYCHNYISKICDKYNINSNDLNENGKLPILMVGDNPNTDMEFAKNINCDKCLVLSGVISINDIQKNETLVDDVDYVIPDISYLCM